MGLYPIAFMNFHARFAKAQSRQVPFFACLVKQLRRSSRQRFDFGAFA
jgi:hypothetical protein